MAVGVEIGQMGVCLSTQVLGRGFRSLKPLGSWIWGLGDPAYVLVV